MTASAPARYEPGESLFLWWLGVPARPRLIGELAIVRTLRGVSLRYCPDWLANGFALSEDLPLNGDVHLP